MKCGNCPIKAGEYLFISESGEQIALYECPFGEHALHLWDHRCTKLAKRKEAVASLENNQNEEVNYVDRIIN